MEPECGVVHAMRRLSLEETISESILEATSDVADDELQKLPEADAAESSKRGVLLMRLSSCSISSKTVSF